jgi:DNA repair protein RadC
MNIAMAALEVIPDQVLQPLAVEQLLADLTDRPRERLWRCGVQALGDAELIALVLGTGVRDRPVLEVAAELVRTVGGIAPLSRASPRELAQFTGIGPARAGRLAAAFELGRRSVEVIHYRRMLGCAADVYRCVAPRLAGVSQELFFACSTSSRSRAAASPTSRSIRARCSVRWSGWPPRAACSCTTTRPAMPRPAARTAR